MSGLSRLLWASALAGGAFLAWSASSATLSYDDLLSRPRPQATLIRHYGDAPHQYAELLLPASKGPHRVIVLIHGGCWLAELPGTPLMDYLAGDLQKRGYAVWNIDYRRVGDAGGGYPGTFLDVAKAIDMLRKIAPAEDLDLKRVVVIGHSAGGQLALWDAARPHLARTSPLYTPDPLPVSAVISLAGIDDLKSYRDTGPSACGGPQTIDSLIEHDGRNSYGDTSPADLLPIGVRQAIVSGALDPIVPKKFGTVYAQKAKSAGDHVAEIVVPNAGHFELIDPQSGAWSEILKALDDLEKQSPPR